MKSISTMSLFASLASCVALAGGVPTVTGVTMTQATDSRRTTISYTLANAPAVVTVDIQTNLTVAGETRWATIGIDNFADFEPGSDVWRKVEGDGPHTITWKPDRTWPDHAIPAGGIRAVVTAWPLTDTPDYMVVDIARAAQPGTQRYYPSADFVPGGVLANTDYRLNKLLLRKIKAKNVPWTMGSVREGSRTAAAEATHEVTLTNNFYIGVFPITQAQFNLVQTNATKSFKFTDTTGMLPADTMTYAHIRGSANVGNVWQGVSPTYMWPNAPYPQSFLGILRSRTGLDFDLPGEAQWEFACRAGTAENEWNTGKGIIAATSADANLPGCYQSNASGRTAIVGSYAPNAWGLYDMHGNVAEVCLDWYEDDISAYNGRTNVDPANPMKTLGGLTRSNDDIHIARGGSYLQQAHGCRSAKRNDGYAAWNPNEQQGCRVVCTAGLE